jgi:hypothetical protein
MLLRIEAPVTTCSVSGHRPWLHRMCKGSRRQTVPAPLAKNTPQVQRSTSAVEYPTLTVPPHDQFKNSSQILLLSAGTIRPAA